jgi:hypothetical protein
MKVSIGYKIILIEHIWQKIIYPDDKQDKLFDFLISNPVMVPPAGNLHKKSTFSEANLLAEL